MQSGPRRITAFSIVELLVVVAIIALLLAIILPSISRVRSMGREAKCAAAQRAIATGILQYTQDFDGYFPPDDLDATDEDPNGWYQVIGEYLNPDARTWQTQVLVEPAKPAWERPEPYDPDELEPRVDYGLNAGIYVDYLDGSDDPGDEPRRIDAIRAGEGINASAVPLLADCDNEDRVFESFTTDEVADRHGNEDSFIVVFLDGSSETIEREDLPDDPDSERMPVMIDEDGESVHFY